MSTDTTPMTIPEPKPARIRFAAIVWGTVLAAISVTTILVIADPLARQAVGEFLTGITVGTTILIGVLVIGFLILVGGMLAVVHRWQRREK